MVFRQSVSGGTVSVCHRQRAGFCCGHIRDGFLFLLGVLLLSCSAVAQSPDEQRQPAYNRPAGPVGVGKYEPGKWGVVSVQLVNPTDSAVELLPVASFQDGGDLQFGRRVWVPPKSRRLTWYPVLAPDSAPAQGRVWNLQSFLFNAAEDNEAPIPATFGQMRIESFLPMGRGQSITGLIADPEDEDQLTTLLWAARLSRNFQKTFALMDREQLPPTVESLDGLDQLVIASDSVLSDTAATGALREWLHRGGRLWLHLNRMDPDSLSQLVGDAVQISVVDHIDRERIQFSSHDSRGKRPSGGELQFDQPVELVRAIVSNARISHTVDDWPVAVWIDAGRGKLLVTLLDGRAWLRPRTHLDQLPHSLEDPTDGVLFVASEPLQEVAFEFLTERDPPRLEPAEFEHVVAEQIGYSIVSRSRVGTILGAFCLALTGAGVVLMRQGRLELVGWLGPAGVALASVVLLGVGRASREAVPKTVAVTQFAETSPYTNEVQMTGLAATYSADRSEDPLATGRGGQFWPAMTGGGGTVLRMISSDRDQWSLQNLVLPAGQQLIPFAQSFRVEQPVTAVGTFGETGLTGTIRPGPFEQTADAVLALPATRNLAVQLQEGGAFTAAAEGLLAPGEFLTETLLSDEQRRRVEIYQALFSPAKKDETPWPAEPVLLVWARPLDPGFQLLQDAAQAGSALVSIPLRLTSPPVGTRVRIPGPFLPYRTVGAEASGTFDERRRRWSGPFPTGLNTTLRFQLPKSVLPLRAESAVLSVDIQAPSRKLQITGSTAGETVILDTRQSPLGRIEFRISREDVLQVSDAGELELGLNVGDARDDESDRVLDPSEAQMWKINDVQLELTGVTMAP